MLAKVWSGTPWVIDVFTDSINSERYMEIRQWCRETFGAEAWPLHKKPGKWQRGGVTINGWTWIGFESEALMRSFMERWVE